MVALKGLSPEAFASLLQDLQVKTAQSILREQECKEEKARHEATAARVQAEIAEAQKATTLRALAEYKGPKGAP